MSDAIIECENYLGRQTIDLQYSRTFWYSLRWDDQSLPESKLGEDLLSVAGVVQIADRAFRRRFRLGELTRTYHVQASVNLPDRWQAAADNLVQALSFLSSDNWEFSFIARSKKSDSPLRERSSRQRRTDAAIELQGRPGSVALFSGGLDSFCGATYLLKKQQSEAQNDGFPVFVSSYLKDLSRLQDKLLKPLSTRTNASYLHLPIYFRADPKSTGGFSLSDFPERTRRTRSFFYIAQAAAFALSHMIPELYLFENGVLALNLPIRQDRTGARSTRHAHPIFLAAMQSFLRSLSQGEWLPEIVNPFAFLTKAEVLQYAGQWSDLISSTVSCWDYGNFTATLRKELNRKEITHCGFCLPCLVRRLALMSADVPDPPAIYGYDVFQAARESFPAPEKRKGQWTEAKALLQFAQQLNELDKWAFYHRYIDRLTHLEPLDHSVELNTTYEMMRRFANDVIKYLG